MDPFTLLALISAAGFIFKKESSQAKKNNEGNNDELKYSKTIIKDATKKSSTNTSFQEIEVIPEYKLVQKLVQKEFPIIFVTGGAGTGKSTFIKWLISEFGGSALLAAPTAMAAINIEGKTIHSLCQLPPGWIIRADIKKAPRRREIQQAKLLIIDEISMVSANLLDGVSAFFRLNRGIDKPFGGLPVILVGDMFQLPPITDDNARDLNERIYGTAKFYNAKCLNEATYYAVELNKTFRQVDQDFVDILSKIREGVEVEESTNVLNEKCLVTKNPLDGSVWLSPTNRDVDHRNEAELKKLNSAASCFKGSVSGNYKIDRLPSPLNLNLKIGAQVMFVKNNLDKKWINGTIGFVKGMNDNCINIEIAHTKKLVDVERVTWSEFKYLWNSETREIDREVTGSYHQFPLVLSWSMTIHKSQGRTIENVHLDLGSGSFETGQTYVALSRCRAMSGLSLNRPIMTSDIIVDEESKIFYNKLREIIKKLPPDELMKQFKD